MLPLDDESAIDQLSAVVAVWIGGGMDEARIVRLIREWMRRALIVLGELEGIH
jgi:hypothetical protein